MNMENGLGSYEIERKDYRLGEILNKVESDNKVIGHTPEHIREQFNSPVTQETSVPAVPKIIKKELIGNVREISDYTIVEITALSRVPIPVQEIRDDSGNISKDIMDLEAKFRCSVLPFRFLGLSPLVTKLRDHEIIEINGEKYASNKVASDKEDLIEKYARNLVDIYLDRAREFEVSLMEEREIDGHKFITCMFNSYELQLLLGLLVNYQAKIAYAKNGEIVLLVGKFDYINK